MHPPPIYHLRIDPHPPPNPQHGEEPICPPILPDGSIPRCRVCGYPLVELIEPVCPECGTDFKRTNLNTFEYRPPFHRRRFWTPGITLAFVTGLVMLLVIGGCGGWWWTIGGGTAVLLTLGVLLGYGLRIEAYPLTILSVYAVLALLFTGLVLSPLTGYVTFALGLLAVLPFSLGAAMGMMLRELIRPTRFSQAGYLP